MNIEFIELNKDMKDLGYYFDYMAKWSADEKINLFTTPNFKEEKLTVNSKDELLDGFLKSKSKYLYIIEFDGKVVGEISIDDDFFMLHVKNKKTAWLGITIGEEEGRGKGVGYASMKFIEKKSRELGLERIELGVFENNLTAYDFYRKLGYKVIAKIEDFTFYDGKWYSDIRMEKLLD